MIFIPGKKISEDIQKAFKNIMTLLEGMLKDRSVPRNIKRLAQRGIDAIKNEEDTPAVIASNVMYLVADLTSDPNIPFHSRSTVYRIISILETIKD